MQLTLERIQKMNPNEKNPVMVIDLYDAYSNPTGTRVEIILTILPLF
jgi:hypothetical protein